MSDIPPTSAQPGPPAAPGTGARTRLRRGAALFGVVLLVGAAAWWYLRPPRVTPPDPPTFPVQEGADPAVVGAVEKARQQVLANPTSAAGWGELGMVFAAHGYEPEADRCFTEAERLDPSDPRWPYFRALFAAVDRPEQTAAHLRRALAAGTAPGARPPAEALASIRLRLAEAHLEERALAEAEVLYKEELARSPGNPRARFGLAQIALTRGDTRAARDGFVGLVDDPFARKRAASQAAALARADGDLAAAQRFAEVARDAADAPPWPDPYLHQLRAHEVGQQGLLREADALAAAGQLHQATEILLEVVRTDPKPRLLVSAGTALARLRDYRRAEALFRECLSTEPANAQANYFLAVVLFEQAGQLEPGRRDQARALLLEAVKAGRTAVATKPDHGLAWLYLGRSLLGVGETADAVEALRQAVACRPEYVDPHLYLGEALAASGERDQAIRSARNAEKLAQPGDPRPRQLLDRLQAKPVTPKK